MERSTGADLEFVGLLSTYEDCLFFFYCPMGVADKICSCLYWQRLMLSTAGR